MMLKILSVAAVLLSLSFVVDLDAITGRATQEISSDSLLIDVRTFEEHIENRIPDSELMPYDTIENLVGDIDKDTEITVYCRTGRRSGIAKQKLEEMGYTNVINIGGIVSWDGPTVTSLGCPDVDYQGIQPIELISIAC